VMADDSTYMQEDHDADDWAKHLWDALMFDMAIYLIDFKSHTHGG
jgi:hypothetical protein